MADPWEIAAQQQQQAPPAAVAARGADPWDIAAVSKAQPGFAERVAQDWRGRDARIENQAQAQAAGEQIMPETVAQNALTNAGKFTDVGTEALRSAGGAIKALTPTASGFVERGAQAIGRGVSNLPVIGGGTLGSEIPKELAANPRLARNLQAAGDALGLIPTLGASGKNIVSDTLKIGTPPEARFLKMGPTVRETAEGIKSGAGAAKDFFSSPNVTADMVKAESQKAYQYADKVGGVRTPQSRNQFIKTVNSLHPPSAEVPTDPAYQGVLDMINARRGTPLTLKGAQDIDQHLGEKIQSQVMPNGQMTQAGKQMLDIQDTLREYMYNPDVTHVIGGNNGFEALQEGTRLWRKQAQLRDIEGVLRRASIPGANQQQIIKSGFSALWNNQKRIRGYDPEIKDMIKDAASSGKISDGLRSLTSRLIPAVATAVHGPAAGVVAEIATSAGRRGSAAVQIGKANKVAKAIGKNYKFNEPAPHVPEPQPILALPAPGKASALPMSDAEVVAAREAINNPSAKTGGVPVTIQGDQSGPINKKPTVTPGQFTSLMTGLSRGKKTELTAVSQMLIDGSMSQNQFVKHAAKSYNLTPTQATALAKEIKTYGARNPETLERTK